MHDKTLRVSAQGDCEILMTRVFDAPRRMVFDAYTKPELLRRWMGVRAGWELAVCEVDLRAGGRYRWVWQNAKRGTSMGVEGVFREVTPPDRLVCTESFDDPWYSGEALLTTTFTEKSGMTTLSIVIRYESAEARDGVLASPMESGVSESYLMLDELLSSLR